MDTISRQSLIVENVSPDSSHTRVNQEEGEVNQREISFTSGQVVAAIGFGVDVVHFRSNIHGDFEIGDTIDEEES